MFATISFWYNAFSCNASVVRTPLLRDERVFVVTCFDRVQFLPVATQL